MADKKQKQHYRQLNRLLGELPSDMSLCVVVGDVDVSLCRELIRDGYAKLEGDGDKEIRVRLTPDGLAFRRSGGYAMPPRDYSLSTLVAAVVAAVSAAVMAVLSILNYFQK